MNVLMVGGSGSFIDNLIIKLKKGGHRVYLLTGSRYSGTAYQKVFEKYNFTYDSSCLSQIFESVNPDLTIYMGAFDTNYRWHEEEADAVRYAAGLMNILMGYSIAGEGRFVYLSSEEVYGRDYPENIPETEKTSPDGMRGMVMAQAEEMCRNYRETRDLDILVLRLDHFYNIPKCRADVRDLCSTMCLEALEKNTITVCSDRSFSMIYESDAVEFIYRAATCSRHKSDLYNISSQAVMTQRELAEIIQTAMGAHVAIIEHQSSKKRGVLSGRLYESEFGNPFFCQVDVIVEKIVSRMKKNKKEFLNGGEIKLTLLQRIYRKIGWLVKALIPFIENIVAFIPFFMLNNRAVGSDYFANLDFYLLYVLLFAIIYGQQQAIFSSVLAVAGYCFRQMYHRSGLDVMLDSNTYVWIAQLFILGLVVGYMRDQIRQLKMESAQERDFLTLQLSDIQDINGSNVRVKNALETQIVNQNDSVGKIFRITSALEQYSSEEVLFYAAEMLSQLMESKDVAIYTVSNRSYARLISFTSEKAKMLGRSIQYTEMGIMYETLEKHKVFINRELDDSYPLMANAIYEQDEMQMILMIWGIPWEKMTLGQANQLVVISSLIQNAVLRANRYLATLEEQRYVENTQILKTEAFSALVRAFMAAEQKGLTECALLQVETETRYYKRMGRLLISRLRQSDYIGTLEDGGLYILLANTNETEAEYVTKRFLEQGLECHIVGETENDAA